MIKNVTIQVVQISRKLNNEDNISGPGANSFKQSWAFSGKLKNEDKILAKAKYYFSCKHHKIKQEIMHKSSSRSKVKKDNN